MTFVYVYALNDELVENAASIYKRIKFIPITPDSIFFATLMNQKSYILTQQQNFNT
jgi:hypothetical protein